VPKKRSRIIITLPRFSHLSTSEEPLFEEGTDAQDVGRDAAESNDEQGYEHRQRGVEHKVVTILVEERTDGRDVRHEEEVDEVDIERATTDILQRTADNRVAGEVLLIVAEIHKGYGQQPELSQRRGQVGPCKLEVVPLDDIGGRKDDDENNYRVEPAAVHDALGLLPVTMYDVAEKEEGEMIEHPLQAQVVQPLDRRHLMSLRPRKYLGQETGLVEPQGDDEQQRDGQPRGDLGEKRQQLALGIGEKVVDDEHPEQGDGEPIAALRGGMEVADEAVGKVIANQRTEQHEEDGRRDELHP